MNESILIFLFLAGIIIIYVMQKRNPTNKALEIEGVEVFRGDVASAELALSALSDQGISAWIENDDVGGDSSDDRNNNDQQHCIHVDPEQLETVKALMTGTIISDA